MSGMDLVQFLRDRLDEDETLARNTGQWGMSWQDLTMDGELRDDVNAGTVAYVPHVATRAHIARHDPARALREVEAKRRLIDWVQRWPMRPAPPSSVGGVLELLALPYANHPDYREDWRP